MKLNQVVERNQHSGVRRPKYVAVNSNKIRSNTYGGKPPENIKGKSFGFRDHNQNPETNKIVRNSRISTTYGSGSNRTNTSTGLPRNKANIICANTNIDVRKIANSHLGCSETQDSSIK